MKRRKPGVWDRARLRRAALAYLSRYAAPSAHVRRILRRRLERGAARGAEIRAGEEDIDTVLADLAGMGLIDDRAWAEAQARALRRRGASARALAARLSSRGAPREEIERLLAGEDDAAELEAARTLARRRRLGPWRDPVERAARREKDLAAMARAGFRLDVARQVIDAEAPPEADQ
ncbi:MAG: regulatory protein RecX [Alphaproteobacteria bacterium]|nr:regulatory protein RecX [Alphaproteobacteria bacterium]